MTMASFELERPQTLAEALEQIARRPTGTRIVAGGSDMVINMRMRIETPPHVLDISGIPELTGIRFNEKEGLSIGALTHVATVAGDEIIRSRFQVLAAAASQVAGPNIRNLGTVGGNLCLDTRCVYYNQSYFWRKANNFCLKKDGTVCHVAPGGQKCWAAYSGDLAPALMVLDGSVRLVSPRGERIIPLSEFFINDGIDMNLLKRDELICEVRVPPRSADHGGAYEKFRVRNSIDYPLAGVAIAARADLFGTCTDARIAITAMNPSPRLVPGVREVLVGRKLTPDLQDQVAVLVRREAKPMRTTVASSTTYRRHMIGVLAKRGLAKVLGCT